MWEKLCEMRKAGGRKSSVWMQQEDNDSKPGKEKKNEG
jgi:hypothetical protein